MKRLFALVAAAVAVLSCCGPKDGEYTFRILTTNDVHGHYFDSLYVSDGTAPALTNVSWYVDSIRTAAGKDNVILIDAGDCLQGDNAAYYYNYIDTGSEHLFGRMVEYMGYDAVVVGNHDIETGHPVYDRLVKEMDVPFLAANAVRDDNGEAYFQEYVTLKRNGLKITIIGFTNPNIKAWLSPLLWSGMTFESLLPFAQETVDRIVAKEKSDVVIVATHAGTGNGDGSVLESQGLDLLNSLKGVDFVLTAHDHRPAAIDNGDICLVNAGSHCRNIGMGTITVKVENGKVVSKVLDAELLPVDVRNVDEKMQELFHADFQAVKNFTLTEVGELKEDLRTSDAYRGMSDYLNLLHTLSLSCEPAQISFAAPLTFDGEVKAGTVLYNDLFTIYPYENQLFVVKMSGKEIKDYLEYSYDAWINTISSPKENLLKIQNRPDPRNGRERWSFKGTAYNFDSAGGLNYVVDVTKPYGERVIITSLADGSTFSLEAEYNVAMTSYRASGGGDIMRKGAGIDTDRIGDRVVEYHPEIRNILYDYLKTNGSIDPSIIGNSKVIGSWKFVPEELAEKALDRDMGLLF